MEERSLFLPVNEGLLHRPRLDALLEAGRAHPYTALVAGPGYGKTGALAKFAQGLPGRLVWLHLQKLDNLPHLFWQHFVEAGRLEAPGMSDLFAATSFPSSPGALDAFLRYFEQPIYEDESLTLVLDDFHLITTEEILSFFERLIAARVRGFRLIFASVTPAQLERLAAGSGVAPYAITLEQLRFTTAEVGQLLNAYGITPGDESVDAVWRRTEGWPLAVNLLATQLRFDPAAIDSSRWVDLSLTEALFEREFYSAYAPGLRALLVKLALLSGFTLNLIEATGEADTEQMARLLADHPFVTLDGGSGIYYYHQMYRDFLQDRAIFVGEEDKRQMFSLAADERLARGERLEAVELLSRAGRYREMLVVIAGFTNTGMPQPLATYLHNVLCALPDQPDVAPLAEYLKATIHLNNMEVHTAERMLRDLAAGFEDGSIQAAEDAGALGEVYLTLAAICLIQNRDCFVEYYRKAAAFLQGGSGLKGKNQCIVGNNKTFFLQHHRAGEVERIERLYHEAEPYIVQVMNGGGRGMADLYSAEAAYLTGRFEAARRHAITAIRHATENDQHDIAGGARVVLATIALHRGDLENLLTPLVSIRADVEEGGLWGLCDLRDTAEGWLYVKMGDLERVPAWLTADYAQPGERAPIDVGQDRILYANYLIRRQDFHGLIELLASLEQTYRMRGHWTSRLNVHIMRAVGHLNLGDEHAALGSLWQAYEMAHAAGVTSPFIEGAWYMRILTDVAKKSRVFPFERAWLDQIHDGATVYMENLGRLMEEYRDTLESLDTGAAAPAARLLGALVDGGGRPDEPTLVDGPSLQNLLGASARR